MIGGNKKLKIFSEMVLTKDEMYDILQLLNKLSNRRTIEGKREQVGGKHEL